MKKKTLLFTTLAGTMLATGLTLSGVNAATEVTSKAKLVVNAPEDGQNAIIVELMKENPKLTEEEVTALIEEKYKTQKLTVADITPVQEDGTVGTGAVITLNTGKKFTVVLYGDTDGNGKVETDDAQVLVDYKYNGKKLTNAQLLAADVLMDDERASTSDAQRIFEYAWNPTHVDGGYAKEEYADWYKEVREVVAEPIKLAVATATSTSKPDDDNTKNIKEAVLEGSDIKLRILPDTQKTVLDSVKKASAEFDLSTVDTNDNKLVGHGKGQWYRIVLTSAADASKIKVEGAILDSNGNLWLNANQGTEIPVTITNLSDPTEVMKVTVKLVDATDVNIKGATNVVAKADNNLLVTAIVADGSYASNYTINVTANVSAMTESKRTVNGEEVNGRWFQVSLITDMPASKLEARNNVKDEDGNYTFYDLEGTETAIAKEDPYYSTTEGKADTYKENTPRYRVLLWVNALENLTQDIVVKSKEAVSTGSFNARKIVITNNGKIQAKAYIAQDNRSYDTSTGTVLKKNLAACSVVEADASKTQNVITVRAHLNEMTKFNLKENKVEEVEKDGGKVVVTENGKKYFGLLLNVGTYDVSQLRISGAEYQEFISNLNNSNNSGGSVTNTILVWLDAEAKDPVTITLEGGALEDAGDHKEKVTLTVKVVDVSDPISTEVRIPENEQYGANYNAVSVNTKTLATTAGNAVTLGINAKVLGMEETKYVDPVTEKEEMGHWFPVVLKTNVPRAKLAFWTDDSSANTYMESTELVACDEYVAGVTGLADDEIVVWVNADKSATTFNLTNIESDEIGKSAVPNKIEKVTINVTDVSTLAVTAQSAVTVPSSTEYKDALNNNETAIANFGYNQATARLTSVAKDGTVAEKDEYGITANVEMNALRKYARPDGTEGKWLALALTVTNSDKLEASDVVDKDNTMTFGNAGKALVWIDADKLVLNEETKKLETEFTLTTKADNKGVVEKLLCKLAVTDISVLTGLKEEPEDAPKYNIAAWDPDGTNTGTNPVTDHATDFKTNMEYVYKVERVDDKTINVYADVEKMNLYTTTDANLTTQGKYIALFVNLDKSGKLTSIADITKITTAKYDNTKKLTTLVQSTKWKDLDADSTNTTALVWLDAAKATNTFTYYYYSQGTSASLEDVEPDEEMTVTINVIQQTKVEE